ncbi:MAG TPA: rod shape-determining protein MreD, partial [Streptosporangiaceae bacterium]|nr:rod shape-determining protein MreD [Streptosporangiaceae bacterium]
MVRGLISFVVVSIAVIVQLTIVDRIAFPGGAGPDVVLLAVAALGLAGGPMTGVLIGFWAGLALDVAPPGSHFVGQNALVFCLIGYACGLAADVPNSEGVPEQGRTALFEIVVTAAGAVVGEALAALLGAMLSDPRVTWSAIRHVLPVAIVYDVLLCPFVLYAAAAALRLAGAPRGERSRAAWSLAAPSSAGAAQGAIRQVNGGNTPRLRLSERGKGEGLGGGLRGPATAKREPRLKLGHGGALGAGTLGAAFANGNSRRGQGLASGTMAGALGNGAAKVKFGARRGGGALGGAMALNPARSGLNTSRFGRSQMGRSLLGGSVFSRSPSALRASAPARK